MEGYSIVGDHKIYVAMGRRMLVSGMEKLAPQVLPRNPSSLKPTYLLTLFPTEGWAEGSRGAATHTQAVTVSQSWPRSCSYTPISQLLGDGQVSQVVLGSSLVVLQQRVGVTQAVASLCFHCLVPELPREL